MSIFYRNKLLRCYKLIIKVKKLLNLLFSLSFVTMAADLLYIWGTMWSSGHFLIYNIWLYIYIYIYIIIPDTILNNINICSVIIHIKCNKRCNVIIKYKIKKQILNII